MFECWCRHKILARGHFWRGSGWTGLNRNTFTEEKRNLFGFHTQKNTNTNKNTKHKQKHKTQTKTQKQKKHKNTKYKSTKGGKKSFWFSYAQRHKKKTTQDTKQ